MQAHISYDAAKRELILLDQRKLPEKEEFLRCASYEQAIDAIRKMAVRGAPAIGVAGAWACVLAAHEASRRAQDAFFLEEALNRIANARPTAHNLSWAVNRMKAACRSHPHDLAAWEEEAASIQAEDLKICRRMGAFGEPLIRDGDTILTHCNAGALATAGYGTALGVIRAAVEAGKKISVIADETRPLLQGSRLTAYELAKDGIPVTVAPDNACAAIMASGKVNLVITGADRIAANGDTANKIGTMGVAILARHFGIPFYIAAPLSTIDPAAPDGSAIPIETRSEQEVLMFNGQRIAPKDVHALNFAFDITPADLISGIITEVGILEKPFAAAISNALKRG